MNWWNWILAQVHRLNDFSGLFLLLIALSVSSCAKYLLAIRSDIECLHEDFDKIHSAHDRIAWEREVKADEHIAQLMSKKS